MPAAPLSLPPAERAASEAAAAWAARHSPRRVLATTVGRGQAARALAATATTAEVVCWQLDDYRHRLALAAGDDGPRPVQQLCLSDPPPGPFDLALLPSPARGEKELLRDQLQLLWERLAVGGALVAAVDNPHDDWLRRQLLDYFPPVTVRREGDATVYLARKDGAPRRVRDFRCQFAFRDRGRLLQAITRPGVFSHRRLDPGARKLLDAAEIGPGERILDVGCGAGVVAHGLAAREPTATVLGIDSHARAIECAVAGAELNELANVRFVLDSQGLAAEAGAFDLAVANPPYYGDFRIAGHFLAVARRALRPGGRLLLVTKQASWYDEVLPESWLDCRRWPAKEYWICAATKGEA